MDEQCRTSLLTEYDRLRLELPVEHVREAAVRWHASHTAPCGESMLRHLFRLADKIGSMAPAWCLDLTLAESRYWTRVAVCAGMLHASMRLGHDYEEIVEAADASVAALVSRLTPDIREPGSRRFGVFLTRLSESSAMTKAIAVLDVHDELEACRRVLGTSVSSLPCLERMRITADYAVAALPVFDTIHQMDGLPRLLQETASLAREVSREAGRQEKEHGVSRRSSYRRLS